MGIMVWSLRLNRDALPWLQFCPSRLAWRIVDVQADVVAQMVGKERFESLTK